MSRRFEPLAPPDPPAGAGTTGATAVAGVSPWDGVSLGLRRAARDAWQRAAHFAELLLPMQATEHGTGLAEGVPMTPASERKPRTRDSVVACTIRGRRASDAVEIVSERDGDIAVVLLDLRAARDQEALRLGLASHASAALLAREPLHAVAAGLRKIVCEAVAASVGVIAIRVSVAEAKVELLNAGMPPATCVYPDGRLIELPSLSSDIGPRTKKAHPYELMPLVAGSVWCLASDGATGGSLEDNGDLWASLGLPGTAPDLADETNDGLAERLRLALGGQPLPEDASLVVVPTHVPRRFDSGIE